jgi:hypothetical protein
LHEGRNNICQILHQKRKSFVMPVPCSATVSSAMPGAAICPVYLLWLHSPVIKQHLALLSASYRFNMIYVYAIIYVFLTYARMD